MLAYDIRSNGASAAITFEGDIDVDAADLIEERVPSALMPFQEIEIYLTGVPFVDSSGIALMITLIGSLKQSGKRVVVRHVQPEVMEVFDMLQLRDILGEDVLE